MNQDCRLRYRSAEIEAKVIARYKFFARLFERNEKFPYGFLEPLDGQYETPFFKYTQDGHFRMVNYERGTIYVNAESQDLDDIMFYIFSKIAKRIAAKETILPDTYGMDRIRIKYQYALELVEKVYPPWSEKMREEIEMCIRRANYIPKKS